MAEQNPLPDPPEPRGYYGGSYTPTEKNEQGGYDYANYEDIRLEREGEAPDFEKAQLGFMEQGLTDKGEAYYFSDNLESDEADPGLAEWWNQTGFKNWARKTWAEMFNPDDFNLLSDEEIQNAEKNVSNWETTLNDTFKWDELVGSWTGITAEEAAQSFSYSSAETNTMDGIAHAFGVAKRGVGSAFWTGVGLFGSFDYLARKSQSFQQALRDVNNDAAVMPANPTADWDAKGNGWLGLGKALWNMAPHNQFYETVRFGVGVLAGETSFSELNRQAYKSMQASASFYSLNADNIKRQQYMRMYEEGIPAPEVMEMYTNPWQELGGSLVIDPLNLLGASVVSKIGGGARTAVKIPFIKKVVNVPWEVVKLPGIGDLLHINLGTVKVADDASRLFDMSPEITRALDKFVDAGTDTDAINTVRGAMKTIKETFDGLPKNAYGMTAHRSTSKAAILARDVGQSFQAMLTGLAPQEIVEEILPAMWKLARGNEKEVADAISTITRQGRKVPVDFFFSQGGMTTSEVIARTIDSGILSRVEDMVAEGRTTADIGAEILNKVNDIAQDIFPSVDEMEASVKLLKDSKFLSRVDDAERAVKVADGLAAEFGAKLSKLDKVSAKDAAKLRKLEANAERAKKALQVMTEGSKDVRNARLYEQVPDYVKKIRAVTKKYEKVWRPATGFMGNMYIRWNPAFTPRNILSQSIGIALDMGFGDAAEITASSFRAYSAKNTEAWIEATQKVMLQKFGVSPRRMFQAFGDVADLNKAGAGARSELIAGAEIIKRAAEKILDNGLKQGAIFDTTKLTEAGLTDDMAKALIGHVRNNYGLTDGAVDFLKKSLEDGEVEVWRMIDPPERLKEALKGLPYEGGTWWDKFNDLRLNSETAADYAKGKDDLLKQLEAVKQRAFDGPIALSPNAPKEVQETVQTLDEAKDVLKEFDVFSDEDVDMFTKGTQAWHNALDSSDRANRSITAQIHAELWSRDPQKAAELQDKYGKIIQKAKGTYNSGYAFQGNVRRETWRLTERIRELSDPAAIRNELINARWPKGFTFGMPTEISRKGVLNNLWDSYFGFAQDLWDKSRRANIKANMDTIFKYAEEAGVNISDLLYKATGDNEPLINLFSKAMDDYRVAERMNHFTKRKRTFGNVAKMGVHYGIGVDDYINGIVDPLTRGDKFNQRLVDTINKYSGLPEKFTVDDLVRRMKDEDFIKIAQEAFDKRAVSKGLQAEQEVTKSADVLKGVAKKAEGAKPDIQEAVDLARGVLGDEVQLPPPNIIGDIGPVPEGQAPGVESVGQQIQKMMDALTEGKIPRQVANAFSDKKVSDYIQTYLEKSYKLIGEENFKAELARNPENFIDTVKAIIHREMPIEKQILMEILPGKSGLTYDMMTNMTPDKYNSLKNINRGGTQRDAIDAMMKRAGEAVNMLTPEQLELRHAEILAKKVNDGPDSLTFFERFVDSYMSDIKLPPAVEDGPVSLVRALYDSADELTDDLGKYTDEVMDRWGETAPTASKWTPDLERAVGEWKGITDERVMRLKAEALSYGEGMRDFLLHDYNKTYLDLALAYVSPFAYWTTRTSKKFVERAVTVPKHAAAYLKYRQFIERKHAGLPDWWKYNINLAELPGMENSNPIFINLEATVNPIYNLTGVDFEDSNRKVDWLTTMVDDMQKFGPTFMTPIQWAMGLRLYAKGENEAADRWMGRLIPQTQAIKSGLNILGVDLPDTPLSRNNELDPFVNFLMGGMDPYERRRVGRALAGMVQDGQISQEQALDAGYAQEGEHWEMAIDRAIGERKYGQLASFFMGVGFKNRTAGDMQVDNFYKEFFQLVNIREALSPLEYKQRMEAMREQYPFMDTVLLSRRSGPERQGAYAYNVLSRIPPGEASGIFEKMGINRATVNKFYDDRGDMEGWQQSERDNFMSAILDMGTLFAVPETATKQEWNVARDMYQQMRTAIEEEFGENIYDEIDGYYRVPKEQKDLYLEDHPAVAQAMDRQAEYIYKTPLLSEYYGGFNNIQQYWTNAMHDQLAEEFDEKTIEDWDMWVRAKYQLMDKKLADKISKENPKIWDYRARKGQFQDIINKKIIEFAAKLPDDPRPELRGDVDLENLTPNQQAAIQTTPQVSFQEYVGLIGEPMAELIVDYYNGEELPGAVLDELDYMAPRNGFYSSRDMLQQILISYQRELNNPTPVVSPFGQ